MMSKIGELKVHDDGSISRSLVGDAWLEVLPLSYRFEGTKDGRFLFPSMTVVVLKAELVGQYVVVARPAMEGEDGPVSGCHTVVNLFVDGDGVVWLQGDEGMAEVLTPRSTVAFDRRGELDRLEAVWRDNRTSHPEFVKSRGYAADMLRTYTSWTDETDE